MKRRSGEKVAVEEWRRYFMIITGRVDGTAI